MNKPSRRPRKPRKTQQKKSAGAAKPAKASKRSPQVSRAVVKAAARNQAPARPAPSKQRKPKKVSFRKIVGDAAAVVDQFPPELREVAGEAAMSWMDDWLNQPDEAGKAEQVEQPSSSKIFGRASKVSICGFFPSANEASLFCGKLFGTNYFWADSHQDPKDSSVRVRRCLLDYALSRQGELALRTAVTEVDLVVISIDASAEKLSATTLLLAKKVQELAGGCGVPVLFLLTDMVEVFAKDREFGDASEARERWLDVMKRKKGKLVDALGCAREDAVVITPLFKTSLSVSARWMLSKLPSGKRSAIIKAMSPELLTKESIGFSAKVAAMTESFGRHCRKGAGHAWRFIRENPQVVAAIIGTFRDFVQATQAQSPPTTKRRR